MGQRFARRALPSSPRILARALEWKTELDALDRAFQVAPPTQHVLAAAARMAAKSRARNVRVRWADAWIAAHTQVLGTYVVSRNTKHNRPLGVPCWCWGATFMTADRTILPRPTACPVLDADWET